MSKKYDFTGETIEYCGVVLYQIVRLSDGLIGGHIQSEDNLSQDGRCFVYKGAKVYEGAKVYGHAQIRDNARVFGKAKVCDEARVYGSAKIYGGAQVSDNAHVFGHVDVCGRAQIEDNAMIYDNARVFDNANISNRAKIYGYAIVCDDAQVYSDAEIHGSAKICGTTIVNNSSEISNGRITAGLINCNYSDIDIYNAIDCNTVTALLTDDGWRFNVGCQLLITKDEFINRIHNEGGGLKENPHRQSYLRFLSLYE